MHYREQFMKKMPITCIAAAGLMGLAPAVMAAQNDTQETRFYVAPMINYNMPDSHGLDPDDEVGGQLNIGKNFGDFFALELYGYTFGGMGLNPDSSAAAGQDASADVYGFGASALFFPARDILPVYALVGGGDGQYHFDNMGSDYDSLDSKYYEVGAGYMFPLNDYGIKLRAEYRYRSTNVDDPTGGNTDFYNNIVSVGIQVPIGSPAQAPAPAPAPVPAPVPVEEPAPIVLQGVHFKFDSAQLTQQATGRLNNVSAALNAAPDVTFGIAGHTDSVGSNAYNQKLSERRAQSVKTYLEGQGIGDNRITSVTGYGESRPVATNETDAGRAQNRRVELNVTGR